MFTWASWFLFHNRSETWRHGGVYAGRHVASVLKLGGMVASARVGMWLPCFPVCLSYFLSILSLRSLLFLPSVSAIPLLAYRFSVAHVVSIIVPCICINLFQSTIYVSILLNWYLVSLTVSHDQIVVWLLSVLHPIEDYAVYALHHKFSTRHHTWLVTNVSSSVVVVLRFFGHSLRHCDQPLPHMLAARTGMTAVIYGRFFIFFGGFLRPSATHAMGHDNSVFLFDPETMTTVAVTPSPVRAAIEAPLARRWLPTPLEAAVPLPDALPPAVEMTGMPPSARDKMTAVCYGHYVFIFGGWCTARPSDVHNRT